MREVTKGHDNGEASGHPGSCVDHRILERKKKNIVDTLVSKSFHSQAKVVAN